MKEISIFGKNYEVISKNGNDEITIENDKLLVKTNENPQKLIQVFLKKKLLEKSNIIIKNMKKEGVEIFGDLDLKVVDKFEDKETLARLKDNQISISFEMIYLPEYALKYILAHELAHIVTKKHTKKFWELVERFYPKFEKGKKIIEESEEGG